MVVGACPHPPCRAWKLGQAGKGTCDPAVRPSSRGVWTRSASWAPSTSEGNWFLLRADPPQMRDLHGLRGVGGCSCPAMSPKLPEPAYLPAHVPGPGLLWPQPHAAGGRDPNYRTSPPECTKYVKLAFMCCVGQF